MAQFLLFPLLCLLCCRRWTSIKRRWPGGRSVSSRPIRTRRGPTRSSPRPIWSGRWGTSGSQSTTLCWMMWAMGSRWACIFLSLSILSILVQVLKGSLFTANFVCHFYAHPLCLCVVSLLPPPLSVLLSVTMHLFLIFCLPPYFRIVCGLSSSPLSLCLSTVP